MGYAVNETATCAETYASYSGNSLRLKSARKPRGLFSEVSETETCAEILRELFGQFSETEICPETSWVIQ